MVTPTKEVGMKVGVVVPQGWTGEYEGWDARAAWGRSVAVATQAERLGFESIWLYDHFHTLPDPRDEITFESFTSLAHLGAMTERVRLGHIVLCAGFRNPALTAKMISSMDVHTGGRMELGIGAGWKRDEWEAYGYGFPSTRDRLGALEDQLAVLTAMMAPGHATHEGRFASVEDAINLPRSGTAAACSDHGRRQRTGGHLAPGRPARRRVESRRAHARCRWSARSRWSDLGAKRSTEILRRFPCQCTCSGARRTPLVRHVSSC
jgi:hypothetical protein